MYKLKCTSNAPTQNILKEFAYIPEEYDGLCISAKFFNHRHHIARQMILAAIPTTIRHLDLGVNFLGSLTYSGQLDKVDDTELLMYRRCALPDDSDLLGDLLSVIPPTVETLDLFGNSLFKNMSSRALVNAFNRLSIGIKTLGLGYNHLNCQTVETWGSIFHALPSHVSSLSLIGSHLYELEFSLIKKLIRSIPVHITFIDLSENGLDEISTLQSDELASVLPFGTTIHVGYCGEGRERSPIMIEGKKEQLQPMYNTKPGLQFKQTAHQPPAPVLPDVPLRRVSREGEKLERSTGNLLPSPPEVSTFFPNIKPVGHPVSREARAESAAYMFRRKY